MTKLAKGTYIFPTSKKSWAQTNWLIITHVMWLEEKGFSEEIKNTRHSVGMFGIADICESLTDEFEKTYKDEEWIEKDYILTTEEFVDARLMDKEE